MIYLNGITFVFIKDVLSLSQYLLSILSLEPFGFFVVFARTRED